MKRELTAIKIKELTPNGFVEIFELDTEHIPEDDDERISQAFDALTKTAMDADHMFLTTNRGSIVIKGLNNKTIRFQPVYSEVGRTTHDSGLDG